MAARRKADRAGTSSGRPRPVEASGGPSRCRRSTDSSGTASSSFRRGRPIYGTTASAGNFDGSLAAHSAGPADHYELLGLEAHCHANRSPCAWWDLMLPELAIGSHPRRICQASPTLGSRLDRPGFTAADQNNLIWRTIVYRFVGEPKQGGIFGYCNRRIYGPGVLTFLSGSAGVQVAVCTRM